MSALSGQLGNVHDPDAELARLQEAIARAEAPAWAVHGCEEGWRHGERSVGMFELGLVQGCRRAAPTRAAGDAGGAGARGGGVAAGGGQRRAAVAVRRARAGLAQNPQGTLA